MWSGLFKMCVNSLSSASSIVSVTDGVTVSRKAILYLRYLVIVEVTTTTKFIVYIKCVIAKVETIRLQLLCASLSDDRKMIETYTLY